MHYYIARVVGKGSTDDPFRPPTDQHFSSIDLRPGGAGTAGHLIVATEEREAGLGTYLGNDAHTLSPGLARSLEARLGVTLDSTPTLAELLAELLIVHGREDDTRWRPLRPRRSLDAGTNLWQIHLGGQVIWERDSPLLTGAAVYSENFDKSNSSTVGPDLTWVEQSGDWSVSGSQLASPSSGDPNIFADAPASSDDHYAKLTLVSGSGYSGVTIRNRYPASGGRNYYLFDWKQSVNTTRFMKRVNDTLSTISTFSHVNNYQVRMYFQADGSSLHATIDDGSSNVFDATDTSLAGSSYLRAGAAVHAASAAHYFDAFQIGDLAVQAKTLNVGGSITPTGSHIKRLNRVFAGTAAPGGVVSQFQRIIVRIFTGSLAGDPLLTGATRYPVDAAVTPGIRAVTTGGATLGGDVVKSVGKNLDGSTTPTGVHVKVWRKVLGGTVAPAASFARSGVRILAGSIRPTGEVIFRSLGRVFGQPGVVAVTVKIAGEVRARVRRG